MTRTATLEEPESPRPAGSLVTLPGLARLWPVPRIPAPSPVLAGAVLTGLLGALCLFGAPPGVGLVLTGVAATGTTGLALRTRHQAGEPVFTRWLLGYGGLALALLAVVGLRAAGWLGALCLLAAFALASVALAGAGGRADGQAVQPTWSRLALGGMTVPLAGLRMPPWALASVTERGPRGSARVMLALRVAGVGVTLLVVFGALFISADAAFGDLVAWVFPTFSLHSAPQRVVAFGLTAGLALAGGYVALAPPRWGEVRIGPARPWGRLEWALPIAALDLLFAVFALVQLTVLFGGHDRVLRQSGLTYAEYARTGFFQLVVATVLTLAVVAWAARRAPRAQLGDRRMVAFLLGGLCLLTLVVAASALRRLALYEDAYGLTAARLFASAVEAWLGLVVLLVLAALVRAARHHRPEAGWLPPTVLASAGVGLLVLALVNPEATVAGRNLERFQRTGKIDTGYLAGLSPDAVPTLNHLPEPQRSCTLAKLDARVQQPVPWYGTTLALARARRILAARPVRPEVAQSLPCVSASYTD